MADGQEIVRWYLESCLSGHGNADDIAAKLEQLNAAELSALLPGLHGTGGTGAVNDALRDTINAVLYRKTAAALVESIRTLDRSTQRLTIAGWAITIVVGVVGVLMPILATTRCGR